VEELVEQLVVRCQTMYCPKLNVTICTIIHEVKFSII
jgi:hypothetical protein